MQKKPPNILNKTVRDPSATIQSILNAAKIEFGRHGFDGTKIEHVARRAKVSKQIIYYYFSGKDELYQEILKDISNHIYKRILEIEYDKESPDLVVRKYIEVVYDAFTDDPVAGVVALDQGLHGGAQLRPINEVQQKQDEFRRLLNDVVKRGHEQGIFIPEIGEGEIEFMTTVISIGCTSSRAMFERYSGHIWGNKFENMKPFVVDFIMRSICK
jgi:AcrR family transcriptional regulator